MKTDKNFRLSKSVKRMLAALPDKESRRVWKEAFIQAETNTASRLTMNYDVSPSGKVPRKAQEKADVNA